MAYGEEAALALLDDLASTWKGAERVLQPEERDLAIEFRRAMQAKTGLIGRKIPSRWIRRKYRGFCRSRGVRRPPPFQAFAEELAKVMPRVVVDTTRRGKRDVYKAYVVQDPNAAVVQFADAVAMHQRG
jgi:hypothetical protein